MGWGGRGSEFERTKSGPARRWGRGTPRSSPPSRVSDPEADVLRTAPGSPPPDPAGTRFLGPAPLSSFDVTVSVPLHAHERLPLAVRDNLGTGRLVSVAPDGYHPVVDPADAGANALPNPAFFGGSTSGPDGAAAFFSPIPHVPSQAGVTLWFQAAGIEAGGPFLGLAALTGALEVHLGT